MWRLIGQERAVALLEHSFRAGRLAHAYLLAGPPHVGKMTLALLLAQALNCAAESPPCLQCPSCRKIAAGTHADVQVIGLREGEDNAEAKLISIEQVREIQHASSLAPFEGKQRVFIIDGAELLSVDAANCLLKTLEEPPDKVTFILLTSNEKLLLPTIVSRCQRLELAPLAVSRVAEALVAFTAVTPERANLLAALAHGCPGWALAAAGDERILQKRGEELAAIVNTIRGGREVRFDYAAQLAQRFSASRRAVYEVLDLWLELWRDLLLIKLGNQELITNLDRRDELIRLSDNLGLAEIRGFLESIRLAAQQLRQNANARLTLEVMMLDMPQMGGEVA